MDWTFKAMIIFLQSLNLVSFFYTLFWIRDNIILTVALFISIAYYGIDITKQEGFIVIAKETGRNLLGICSLFTQLFGLYAIYKKDDKLTHVYAMLSSGLFVVSNFLLICNLDWQSICDVLFKAIMVLFGFVLADHFQENVKKNERRVAFKPSAVMCY